MFLSAVTKNLNWGILTKNLVTFKRWDVVKDEKNLILWRLTEKSNFKGGGKGGHGKLINGGNCLKLGLWTVCRFNGGMPKKCGGEVVFLRGIDTPMHTMTKTPHHPNKLCIFSLPSSFALMIF